MIRLKSFTQMLDEKTVSKEECVKRFEKFVFGEVLGKKEKDTKIEARIVSSLQEITVQKLEARKPLESLLQSKNCWSAKNILIYSKKPRSHISIVE